MLVALTEALGLETVAEGVEHPLPSLLDVTATIFMILGSSKGAFTLHGVLGYFITGGLLVAMR